MKMLTLNIHHNKDPSATIQCTTRHRNVYHNKSSKTSYIKLPDKIVLQFTFCENGLYYLDNIPDALNDNLPAELHQPYSLLSTVKQENLVGLRQKIKEQRLLNNYRNS
eukprot:8690618-Ditylum_brightwellii.AAC.1